MDLNNLKSEAEKILSSGELNPVDKVRGIDQLIKPNFDVSTGLNNRGVKPNQEHKELFTELANSIRQIIRESAWGGSEPISLKEALNNPDLFDDNIWDLLESWIDHDRDLNWNYVNLVQFNLKNNKKSDGSGFWLSPQHFRMAAIIDTVGRELQEDTPLGFDLDLAKSLYKNENQIPQAISNSISTLRHA